MSNISLARSQSLDNSTQVLLACPDRAAHLLHVVALPKISLTWSQSLHKSSWVLLACPDHAAHLLHVVARPISA